MKIISNNGSVYILSLDAKDIWRSNHYVTHSPVGYNIRDQSGSINLRRFINTLDYSLDLIKLREVYEKVYRRTDFSFIQNGKEYTKRVINVTFKYSVKEYNKLYRDVYVKDGYSQEDFTLKDCVYIKNGELIAIQINAPVLSPLSNDLLGDFFYFEDGTYKAKKSIRNVIGVAELRRRLYQDGFYCDGIKYIRYKRSSGSSRVGKCLFIDERLYNRMHKWEMCGIRVRQGQEIDLAALEAYISLPLSSIIDTLEINPENILLIDDYESVFEDKIISVGVKNDMLFAVPKRAEIKNPIWDGQSLIDPSIMGKYFQYGFVLLRNRFFKSACFNCNIQQWFQDHEITEVSQLSGYTIANDISQIKLITTPSSIKYLKFGKIEDWLKNLDPIFGVVKHDKPTHFFDGRMVQVHYQLLNSLHMTRHEVDDFIKPSLEYLRLLKTDPAVLRYHIKYPMDSNFKFSAVNSKNDVVYKMLGINEDFSKTRLYNDFKNDLVKSFVKNLRCGHVLVNGTYATLLGNPIEMLLSSIGQFDGESQIGINAIHTTRFSYGSEILGSRSPHVTAGNILLTQNRENDEVDRYINLTNEIVCVNSINENLLNRLSGSDFDSDTLILTDNPFLVESAKKHYNEFLVPTSMVPGIKLKRRYTSAEKADLDIKTSVNKIGEIINLSQELNTILWDRHNLGEKVEELMDLYCDISKLDVLSNLEIDKSKKEYVVDSVKEIKTIKEKYNIVDEKGRKIKPNFFGEVAKHKGYYDPIRKNYRFHNSTMDYIQHSINCALHSIPSRVVSFLPFSSLLKPFNLDLNRVAYTQVNRILSLVRGTNERIRSVYADDNDLLPNIRHSIASEIRQECVEYIDKISLNSHTMFWLLRSIESEQCKDVRRLIFGVLFGAPNKSFFELIKESKGPLCSIEEDKNGEITIYDFKFSRRV